MLEQISRGIRDELREIADRFSPSRGEGVRETEGRHDDVEVEERSENSLRDTLKDLGREFRHELRTAFRGARSRDGLDAHALLGAVNSAFDRLVSGVEATVRPAASGTTVVAGVEEAPQPSDATGQEVVRVDEAVSADETVPASGSTIESGSAEGETGSGLQIDLSSLIERFEAGLSKLQSRFAPPSIATGTPGHASFSFSLNVTTIRVDITI